MVDGSFWHGSNTCKYFLWSNTFTKTEAENYNPYDHMAINEFVNTIEPAYKIFFKTDSLGCCKLFFINTFNQIIVQYGRFSPAQENKNCNKMDEESW